ncbi:hypothetical protein BGW36DRAFT_430331 [Talaromyces proteolyticus]|uniref:Uncharacterized protein n=1 Tax=Talaromyces proteolyticus TaxID=1131652 RepID=A0AAD4KKK2_9EURO|nr:uncharacterized protein BGW36DRAFT_430331 [Talaromyces proteolyticus]KAH8694321.1 hypothetical protein BGW36DRAFT_430331 [Talaromyces proteolyticus]
MAHRIPIILCGKTVNIGAHVTHLLKPEFEVIHFITSTEAAKAELADLLTGQAPKIPNTNNVGTNDYSKPPQAIVFGRGYLHTEIVELNKEHRGISSSPVAWIVGDPDVRAPAPLPPDYAVQAAHNVKRAFERWKAAGGTSEIIVLY